MSLDWPDLLATVTSASTMSASPIHGETHWRRVAALGLELAASDPDIDAEIVVLFGMTHDARRSGDGLDVGHGPRAVPFARGLDLGLSDDRLDRLCAALAGHSLGTTTDDPTIGACWDADRLDLYRLGRIPRGDLLSTPYARTPALHARALELLSRAPTWPTIFKPRLKMEEEPRAWLCLSESSDAPMRFLLRGM